MTRKRLILSVFYWILCALFGWLLARGVLWAVRFVCLAALCCAARSATIAVACGSATDVGFSGAGTYAWTSPALALQSTSFNALRASNGAAFTYTFANLPFGPYWITLQFLEPNKTAAGQRTFAVFVNGSVVLPSVDVFAIVGGALKPLEIILPQAYVSPVTITFTPILGNAVVSGIKPESVP